MAHKGGLSLYRGKDFVDGRWYVVGASFSPSGIRVNAYVPKCVVNVVFSLLSGMIRIYQHPELASGVLLTCASPKLLMH